MDKVHPVTPTETHDKVSVSGHTPTFIIQQLTERSCFIYNGRKWNKITTHSWF